jgi:cytochrome P450
MYQMRSPRVFVLEPLLAREILVGSFKNFRDNEFSKMFDANNDPLFARNPFLSRGDEWKERRTEISPAFSSNRIKCMFPLIQFVCGRLVTFIREELSEPIETRDLTSKYTTDVVSNCIFGIESNCLNKEDNELRTMSKRLFKPSGITIAKVLLTMIIPQLKPFINVQFLPDDVTSFFMSLIDQAVDFRIKSKIAREDFLDYLIELQKKKGFSSTDLAGHTITFFGDGLETSSISIAYALYEVS